jgi:hypothetical protein
MRKLTSGRLLWSPVELDDLPPLPLGNPFHALRELSRHVKRNYFCHGSIPTGILFFCRTALPPHPVRHHSFASTTMVPIGAKSFHPRFIKPLSSVSDAIREWPTQVRFWFELGMFTRHGHGPEMNLCCPHATGSKAFSTKSRESLQVFTAGWNARELTLILNAKTGWQKGYSRSR